MRVFESHSLPLAQNCVWPLTTISEPETGTLDGNTTCDVCIIGAGITGLSAGLRLAQEGRSVVILEANHIGFGGSGRSTGMVNAGIWLDPNKVEKTIGAKFGARLNRALAQSNVAVFGLIDEFDIQCGAVRNGSVHLAHKPQDIEALQDRCHQMTDLGCKTRFVGADEITQLTNARGYHAGLLDENAGTINPLAYVQGLAHAAIKAGVRIFENHRAAMPRRENNQWQIPTQTHSVSAPFVLVATNAYSNALTPSLVNMTIPMPFLHIATDPLGALSPEVLNGGTCAWDTRNTAFCFRKDPEDRLIFGTFGSFSCGRLSMVRRWAKRQIEIHLPQLTGVPFRDAWLGHIGVTPSRVPQFVELGPNMIAPLGYNGRGIGPGTVFGRNLADYVTSGYDQEVLHLPLVPPTPIKLRGARARILDLGATGLRLIGRR